MKKKILYIPMDVKIREYYAKLLFSIYAAHRGYQIVFGKKSSVNKAILSMPPGIYIGLGIGINLGEMLTKAQSLEHRAVSWDEEGLIYNNRDDFLRTRVDENILKDIDYFFAWGEHHNDLVRAKAPGLDNFSAIGNVRFELLKRKYRVIFDNTVKSIKDRYGDFILLNSNLGVFNHYIDSEYYFRTKERLIRDNEEFYRERFLHQKDIFESFKSLVLYLAPKIAPMNIVIRPHPSENIETWKDLKLPNVYIDNSGSAIAWILASNAVIHKNCTTAAEAVYLERQVITYSTKDDDRYDNAVTGRIGKLCCAKEEVMSALSVSDEENAKKNQQDRAYLDNYISNMKDGENVNHAILDILDKIESPSFDINDCKLSIKQRAKQTVRNAISGFRHKQTGTQGTQDTDDYIRHKFPSLTSEEIRSDIKCLSQAIGLPGHSIHAKKISDCLYRIAMIK